MIESTTLSVDYWVFSKMSHITHCFLTHAHTDHIVNLNSNWRGPRIICSEVYLRLK
jgi:phosphoribosyl 1,2-cyclic phosphodiesterase